MSRRIVGLKITYIVSSEDRLIHSCKPFFVPSTVGISEWINLSTE